MDTYPDGLLAVQLEPCRTWWVEAQQGEYAWFYTRARARTCAKLNGRQASWFAGMEGARMKWG